MLIRAFPQIPVSVRGFSSTFLCRQLLVRTFAVCCFFSVGTGFTQELPADQCIHLHWVGSVHTPGGAQGVTVSGTHAYVADRSFGLQVIDISNPQSPARVGSVDTPGDAWGVTASGTHAYVADRSSGLQVIDISSPQSPAIVGSVDTPADPLA